MDPRERSYEDDYVDSDNSEYDTFVVPKRTEYNDDEYDH